MKRRHVIFDLFGTLAAADTSRLPIDAGTFFRYGHDTWVVEDVDETTYFSELCEEHGCDPKHLADAFQRVVKSIEFFPGIPEMLQELDETASLHLLSNTGRSTMRFIEDEPAMEVFKSITLSCHVRAAKPDLRAFKAVLRKSGASPRECIMVGDDERCDILPARALGMETVKVKKYDVDAQALKKRIQDLLDHNT